MTKGSPASPLFLGIEGGGTRTVALLVDANGELQQRIEAGPANLRLLTDRQLASHFKSLSRQMPVPSSVAIGLAGARTGEDRSRVRRAAAQAWPGIPCLATNDLETALAAAAGWNQKSKIKNQKSTSCQVLILSGTGSCCYGRTASGKTAKIGGWGHLLGDKGSGYEIGLRALKAVVYYLDRDGTWSKLGRRLLRRLQLNEPDDLIAWVQSASKSDIAALAPEVFAAWTERDPIAADILKGAAHGLARDAGDCARRLVRRGSPVQFVLAGGVLLGQPRFARNVSKQLRRHWPGSIVTPLNREGAWGAVELARRNFDPLNLKSRISNLKSPAPGLKTQDPRLKTQDSGLRTLSPTEQRNPRSSSLDRLTVDAAIRLMLSEDAKIPAALLAERAKLARAIHWIVRSFQRGGRLFYVGAGTSGRLGVLDASECPPTFRTPPDLVQGIIAGGQQALWRSVEGAEDDPEAGARAIQFRSVGARDVVMGIAASGRTPFVWGALGEARKRRARTVLLCFNPNLRVARCDRPDLIIAPGIGPEVLTGSTRLKAGTATKLVLNILTTLAMVRMGKVAGNLMIDLNPSNVKLRDRAVRIVRELTGTDESTARAALVKSGWVVKEALRMLCR